MEPWAFADAMNRDEEKNPYKPFHPRPVDPKYHSDRGFVVEHTELDVTIDTKARSVRGKATHRVVPFHGARRVTFDADGLTITSVRVEGRAAKFETYDDAVHVIAPRKLKEARPVDVEIRYRARPRRGLYFVGPTKDQPKKPVQAWTQGEAEDHHAWFPGYDHPLNKTTWTVSAKVRDPLRVIGNGRLVEAKAAGKGWTRYTWAQERPQPLYLLALVIGAFEEKKESMDGLPLSFFVPKQKASMAHETFKNTANILSFFGKALDYPYPFPKYDQAVVTDFMWGGMENTSLTTVNERFLVDAKHRHDADPDGLVAHEAAHQWFGDLVTTRNWEHLWLNEAFATYFDALWHEEFHGRDRLEYEMKENASAYLAEDTQRYRRPIVTKDYVEPEDLFDRHTYQKGSLVLHLLRHELGDAAWWKAMRHYVQKHAWKNVETDHLRLAIEEATGRNLEWFFDQWVFGAGHPEIECQWSWDEKHRQVRLRIKQTQKVAGDTSHFRFKLDVRVWKDARTFKDESVEVRDQGRTFAFTARERPACVQVDPHGYVLKALKFEKDAQDWRFQLRHAASAHGRFEAANGLAKKGADPENVEALRRALLRDRFWAVRREAATALGRIQTDDARDALMKGAKDRDSLVRRAAAAALGNFVKDDVAVQALIDLVDKDASDFTKAAALGALGRTRHPKAFTVLRRNTRIKSHNDVVAGASLAGLADTRDARAIDVLTRFVQPKHDQFLRTQATIALGRLWEFLEPRNQKEVADDLRRLLRDGAHAQRRAVIAAMEHVRDGTLVADLQRVAESDAIGLLRNAARDARRRLVERLSDKARVGDLQKALDEVKQQSEKLAARVQVLEASAGVKPRSKARKR